MSGASGMTRREIMAATGGALMMGCVGGGGGGGGSGGAAAVPPRARPRPAPRTILVLGGTGYLGPHFVEAALAHGHTVTLFNRGKTHAELFPQLEKLHGDRDGHLEALVGRRWDAVLDTSGYVPRIVQQSAELLAPSVGHYVFVSSISAYADPLAPHSDERAPLATLSEPSSEDVGRHYGALKARCEAVTEAALPGRATIVRPGLIVGPGDPTDRFTYWPARLARGGEALAPGDGSTPAQVIDVRDLAAWLVRVVEDGLMGPYNAVGPAEPMTMRAMLEACNAAAGAGATLTWVDRDFLAAQDVAPWSELPVWVDDNLGFATVDARKATATGLAFRPLEDTARATLAWWQAEPEARRAAPKNGLAPDKEARVLAAWKARAGR